MELFEGEALSTDSQVPSLGVIIDEHRNELYKLAKYFPTQSVQCGIPKGWFPNFEPFVIDHYRDMENLARKRA